MAAKKSLLGLLIAFALPAIALIAPSAAAADRLSCGETIHADTVLQEDVSGCTGTALVIGADGVSLNLGGHSVEGTIAARGHSDVAVIGGTVRGGIQIEDASGALVRRVKVRGGSIACTLSSGCTIVRNSVHDGGIAVVHSRAGAPNVVRGNVVTGAAGAGITANFTGPGTSVVGNLVRGSGTGIETLHSDSVRIAYNFATRNTGDGISGAFGGGSKVAGNVVADNGGNGIAFDTWLGPTVLARNLVIHNKLNGIAADMVSGWLLARNIVAGNGQNGILLSAARDTIVAGNRAARNGALGIAAGASGATDGGRNRARMNGDAAQCAGVACG